MTISMANKSVSVLTVPDCLIDLDSQSFYCSSTGMFDEERLRFFENKVFPLWYAHHYSLHQLANALIQFDISLWTAPEVALTKENAFAFWMRFDKQYQGDILVQCELLQRGRMH
ncbi:hypothetical protein [Avibacterium sp. 21-599]|uniref:hypothetical protein n=1 Tax=Avibacterium sp. 21-599 TaxID=2911528 RepID=UPI00224829FC|nr:hypothetical protein [Avibacterium sp. 21-599]MCW9718554.1 hypothetical protein [Avibacterium sp. 21-599]